MRSPDELQSIVQAAIMYYKEHMNQQEIAEKMGITRQTVSKLLHNAEESGVVEFRIHNPLETLNHAADRLARKYNIPHAIVVPCRFDDTEMVATILAQYAAQYVIELIDKGARNIGMAWGRSVYRTVINMPQAHCEDAVFFPLLGATDQTADYFMINEMVRRTAETLNASPFYAYIPANPGTPEDAALFRRTSTYQELERHWGNIDLAILGIGSNPQLELGVRAFYPGEANLPAPILNDAVGDMLTHYFDAGGNFLKIDNAEFLCASVENLCAAKHVLAIAGGKRKVSAIDAALRTGVITDLITDQRTCERLLHIPQKSQ